MRNRALAEDIVRHILSSDLEKWDHIWEYEEEFVSLVNEVEDMLDSNADFSAGVNLVVEKFPTEGEQSALLIEGDILHPGILGE